MGGAPKFEPSQSLPDVSYAEVANAMGIPGIAIDRDDDIGPTWDRALAADGPTVLDIRCDPEMPPIPPHATYEQIKELTTAILKGDPEALHLMYQGAKDQSPGVHSAPPLTATKPANYHPYSPGRVVYWSRPGVTAAGRGFGPTKTTTGLRARIAVVAVAVSTLAAGRAFERTMAAPHVSPVPYRLIQEPDAGYQPIIDLIRSAVSSVRMTTYAHAEDDAVTALADAHRRGVDVKVILDPHSTVSTPTKQPTMRFTPPASTSNGRPMMRSITRNHRRRPHYRRRRYRKPHQEVLRDLARCLHSHHQHQRRRRHRRHLRHPLHRRAPRK